jgi:hypothetical protein
MFACIEVVADLQSPNSKALSFHRGRRPPVGSTEFSASINPQFRQIFGQQALYIYSCVFIAEVACGRRVFASQHFLEVELYSLTTKNTAEQRILTNGYAAYDMNAAVIESGAQSAKSRQG